MNTITQTHIHNNFMQGSIFYVVNLNLLYAVHVKHLFYELICNLPLFRLIGQKVHLHSISGADFTTFLVKICCHFVVCLLLFFQEQW